MSAVRLPAKDVALTPEAKVTLAELESSTNPTHRSIARRARAFAELLRHDSLHGEAVKKNRLPPPLVAQWGLENLYVEDLPGFWRLLYTVARHGAERTVIILRLVDHRSYDRLFPGRGR